MCGGVDVDADLSSSWRGVAETPAGVQIFFPPLPQSGWKAARAAVAIFEIRRCVLSTQDHSAFPQS